MSSAFIGDVIPIPTFPLNSVFVILLLPKTTEFDPSPVASVPITISLLVWSERPPLRPYALYPMYIDDVKNPFIFPPALDPKATFLFPSAPNNA